MFPYRSGSQTSKICLVWPNQGVLNQHAFLEFLGENAFSFDFPASRDCLVFMNCAPFHLERQQWLVKCLSWHYFGRDSPSYLFQCFEASNDPTVLKLRLSKITPILRSLAYKTQFHIFRTLILSCHVTYIFTDFRL